MEYLEKPKKKRAEVVRTAKLTLKTKIERSVAKMELQKVSNAAYITYRVDAMANDVIKEVDGVIVDLSEHFVTLHTKTPMKKEHVTLILQRGRVISINGKVGKSSRITYRGRGSVRNAVGTITTSGNNVIVLTEDKDVVTFNCQNEDVEISTVLKRRL